MVTITVVTGPPGGGKSTYIRERAQPGDVVIDLDRLALALTTEGTEHHAYPKHVTTVAVSARRAAIDCALQLPSDTHVWIIETQPTQQADERYREAGAEIVLCDPGREVVVERVQRERPQHIKRVVDDYYSGKLRRSSRPTASTRLEW